MGIEGAFPVNCWHVTAASASVSAEHPLAMMVAGEPLVLFRSDSGEAVALEDRCAHRHAPLSLGRVEPRGLRCMYHGLLFARNGHCIEIPGQDDIPPRSKVRAYPIVERYGWIWVWPGDPSIADGAMVPAAIAGDHPDWLSARSHLDYDAHFGLLVDNLLDFSHLAFVHADSFRADPKWAIVRPNIRKTANGLRIERWIPDAPALMSARELAGAIVDTWQGYDFVAPGVLIMETCYCAPGAARAARFGAPAAQDILVRNGAIQAVTPMTERTTRYFFAVALPVDGGGQAICDQVLSTSRVAFLEDKIMIEAQQARIDQFPEKPSIPTAADSAIIMFHAILRATQGEQEPPSAKSVPRKLHMNRPANALPA